MHSLLDETPIQTNALPSVADNFKPAPPRQETQEQPVQLGKAGIPHMGGVTQLGTAGSNCSPLHDPQDPAAEEQSPTQNSWPERAHPNGTQPPEDPRVTSTKSVQSTANSNANNRLGPRASRNGPVVMPDGGIMHPDTSALPFVDMNGNCLV